LRVLEFCTTILLSNAFVLGFRHGVDWDHLAAIGDIVGTSHVGGGRPLYLTFLYAVGHSIVVIALSFLALAFAAEVPDSIKQSFEIVVGISLLIFGIGVAISVLQAARFDKQVAFLSRWMLLSSSFSYCYKWLKNKIIGKFTDETDKKVPQEKLLAFRQYDTKAALGLGALHGLGAETATQLLIIGAVGNSTSREAAVALLFVFVAGFVVSSTAIAALFSGGLLTTVNIRSLYLTVGILVSTFSVTVGTLYLTGQAQCLPSLQRIWGGG